VPVELGGGGASHGELADALRVLATYCSSTALALSMHTHQVLIGRTLVAHAVIKTVERTMEVAGGAGFFRSFGLERLFRDVQGARYHQVREPAQVLYTGRLALGLDVNG
jgi:acyl-CoA dehydrogenase